MYRWFLAGAGGGEIEVIHYQLPTLLVPGDHLVLGVVLSALPRLNPAAVLLFCALHNVDCPHQVVKLLHAGALGQEALLVLGVGRHPEFHFCLGAVANVLPFVCLGCSCPGLGVLEIVILLLGRSCPGPGVPVEGRVKKGPHPLVGAGLVEGSVYHLMGVLERGRAEGGAIPTKASPHHLLPLRGHLPILALKASPWGLESRGVQASEASPVKAGWEPGWGMIAPKQANWGLEGPNIVLGPGNGPWLWLGLGMGPGLWQRVAGGQK